jgi:SAM-dependent methyltransferase
MENQTALPPSATMLNLINGFQVARALFIAARLRLADLVHGGVSDCTALAALSNTDAPSLYRVLRVLVSAGVFEMDEHGNVKMNPLAQTLISDAPGSLRAWAISQIGDDPYKAWGDLMYSVQTGGVAFERVFGCDSWAHRAKHPQSAKDFDEGMASFVSTHNEALLNSYPFGELGAVVDVGGGDGKLLATLLAAHPAMRGVLFEQPRVIEKASQRMAAGGLTARCTVVAGDMFESVPAGGDAYILSRVLHDWTDERAIAILRNCRKAMAPGGKVLLVERVIPARIENSAAMRVLVASDLHMMVMNGGRERTETQYRALFAAADLTLTRVAPAGTAMNVIEAVPV